MKRVLDLFALVALGALSMRADIIITLIDPNQTGVPGQTLSFFGTIANNSADTNPADGIYLNNDGFDLGLSDASYSLTDNFADTPLDLAGGQLSACIDLFDVTLSDPQSDPFGQYSGTYTLLGGADGGSDNAQDYLAQAGFSVTTVAPEPGTMAMVTCVILALMSRAVIARAASNHRNKLPIISAYRGFGASRNCRRFELRKVRLYGGRRVESVEKR